MQSSFRPPFPCRRSHTLIALVHAPACVCESVSWKGGQGVSMYVLTGGDIVRPGGHFHGCQGSVVAHLRLMDAQPPHAVVPAYMETTAVVESVEVRYQPTSLHSSAHPCNHPSCNTHASPRPCCRAAASGIVSSDLRCDKSSCRRRSRPKRAAACCKDDGLEVSER